MAFGAVGSGLRNPEGWNVTPLWAAVTHLTRGATPNYVDEDTGFVAFNQKCVRPDKTIDLTLGKSQAPPSTRELERAALRTDDIVINSTGSGTLGRAGLVDVADQESTFVADSHVTILRTDRGQVSPRYLWYVLSADAFYGYANDVLAVGSTNQTELAPDRLGAVRFLLPPRPAQAAAVEFLDQECARIDELVTEQRRFAALATERFAATLEHAIWGEHPSTQPLQQLVDPARPITYGIVLTGPAQEEGVRFAEAGSVSGGVLNLETLRRTTTEIEAEYRRSRLCEGDIVIAIRGSVGKTALVPALDEPLNMSRDAARISPTTGAVDSRWLLYVMRTQAVQDQIGAGSLGSAVRGINLRDLRRSRIPVLPLAEQSAVAAHLARVDLDVRQLNEEASLQVRLLQEHKQALITAVVTGK